MAPFEYLVLFAAIVMAIAVTDLATSLHRLLAAGPRVRWHWLAPLAALVAFLKIVTQWWTWYEGSNFAQGLTFELFLGVLAVAILLVLLAAAALPDEFGKDETMDLEVHYATVSRRYWILFALHWTLWVSLNRWGRAAVGGERLDLLDPTYLIGPLALSLVFVRNRWWHTICLAGFVILYVARLYGRPL